MLRVLHAGLDGATVGEFPNDPGARGSRLPDYAATAYGRAAQASFDVEHRRMHGMVGVEAGYSYAGSPLIAETPPAEWETSRYEPKALPGARIPHMWLDDGQALQDILGDDYTLLELRGDADTASLEEAFRTRGAPLAVVRRDEPRVRDVYGASVFLLRPDLHIVWRGDGMPADPVGLVMLATGWVGGGSRMAGTGEPICEVPVS
jgi:hypothetical protein